MSGLQATKLGGHSARWRKLLILTGQRLNEVSRLRWAEIDMNARLWILPRQRTKSNVAHTVPLSSQSVSLLAGYLRYPVRLGSVFTTTGYSPVGGFSRAKTRIDAAIARSRPFGEPIARWTFHDLRRTAASGMARLKIDIHVVEKVLNHSSGELCRELVSISDIPLRRKSAMRYKPGVISSSN